MELEAYEGGSGGKVRRRPFRRSPVTPYDRPPSAARGMRGLATAAGSGGGWISKLVDPASRFIAGRTSRLFSTVFRKRLPAPTEVQGSEKKCQVKLYVPEAVDVGPSESEIKAAVDGHNPKDFGTSGISEIEQLLKQKIYTRAQVEYLTGLICLRTFEPSVQSESNNEKANFSEEGNEERSTSLNRKLSTSETDLTIPQDIAASPAEIAKAYMSSRLPKTSSSALSLQSRVFQKNKSSPSSVPCAQKPHDLPVVPRSLSHISEINGISSAGYPASKSRGRSAMYRMSRSPYFKVNPAVNVNVSEFALGSNAGPESSQLFAGRISNSYSRQALKRDSSFLDSEDSYIGPIRRIRQKSGLCSDKKCIRFMPSTTSHHSSLFHLDKCDLKDPTSEKPHSLNELMCASSLQNAENGDKIFSSNLPPIPMQSSEACRKILEQLDKFAPSREEKSNLNSISMDELPSELSTEMLNGRARRNMDIVDASQFTSIVDTSDNRNAKCLQEVGGFQLEKPGKALGDVPSSVEIAGVKFETVANGLSKQVILSKASMPSISSVGTTIPVPATVHLRRKPAFQMTAPEDLLELDDEQDAVDVSARSTPSVVKADPRIAETQASIFSKLAPENLLLPPSRSMSFSSATSLTEISKKTYDTSQVSEKECSFRFSAATGFGALSPPSLAPTMPFPSHDKLAFQNDQTPPTFMFGSQNSGTPFSSTTAPVANEPLLDSKSEISWPGRKNQLEGFNQFSDRKTEVCLHKSPGIVASSSLQALGSAGAINLGTSITSTQSNGSVHSSSLTSLPTSTQEAISESLVNLISSENKLTEASSYSPHISTISPVISPTTAFSFGAAASTAVPVLVSLSSDTSMTADSGGKVANKSPLGSFNLPTMQVTSAFLSVGNSNTSLMGSSPFPDAGSTPLATNSTSAAPSTFSQVSRGGFGFVAPSSSSAQTSGLCSAASGSSQDSSTMFGSTGGSIFGIQPDQSGSGTSVFSQSSTNESGSFSSSATLGSIISPWPSSSACGLNGTSSLGLGQMPFGITDHTIKSFGSTSGFSFTSAPNICSSGFSFSSGTALSTTSSSFPSIASVSSSSSALSSTAGFSFGLTAPALSVPSFSFGSSSGSIFSFTSSGASASAAPASPIFGMSNTSGVFSSVSPSNDQMNVEDTMADDTNQMTGPIFPTFGQPSSTPASSNFLFGSAVPSGGTSVFQFGCQQNSIPQNSNPFQASGNLEFAPGGSFSLGSGGGEKSARKIVKVRRDKIRRK